MENCLICGERLEPQFLKNGLPRKYCSYECYRIAMKEKKRVTKEVARCEVCGKEFWKPLTNSRVCSDPKCRKTDNQRYRTEYKRAIGHGRANRKVRSDCSW